MYTQGIARLNGNPPGVPSNAIEIPFESNFTIVAEVNCNATVRNYSSGGCFSVPTSEFGVPNEFRMKSTSVINDLCGGSLPSSLWVVMDWTDYNLYTNNGNFFAETAMGGSSTGVSITASNAAWVASFVPQGGVTDDGNNFLSAIITQFRQSGAGPTTDLFITYMGYVP